MQTATKKMINLRIDPKLKSKAEAITDDMGLSMTAAIVLFLKAMVRENGLPFSVSASGEPVRRTKAITISKRPAKPVVAKKKATKIKDEDFDFDNLTSLKNAIKKL